jgi:hypothetical protein
MNLDWRVLQQDCSVRALGRHRAPDRRPPPAEEAADNQLQFEMAVSPPDEDGTGQADDGARWGNGQME